MTLKVSPSIVSAPITNLKNTVEALEEAKADYLHFDIEDGSFVPEINLGVKIIKELRVLTKLPFEVHLMMNNPEWLLPKLADYGANLVSVHYEACPYPRRTLRIIKELGLNAGLAFNPKSPLPDLDYFHPYLDYVLILSTEPESGHCTFLPNVLEKVTIGKQRCCYDLEWFVDGGITSDNVSLVVQAGADVIVSGRGVFSQGNLEQNIRLLKSGS